jgi:hypothetical protein
MWALTPVAVAVRPFGVAAQVATLKIQSRPRQPYRELPLLAESGLQCLLRQKV